MPRPSRRLELHGKANARSVSQAPKPARVAGCVCNIDQEATDLLTAIGMKPKRISPASPWQNGAAERWIANCRRELLDHVIIFNEAHLLRLAKDYPSYYHTDRTHDGLEKDRPATRAVAPKPTESARLVAHPRVGGLHHRYEWQQAA